LTKTVENALSQRIVVAIKVMTARGADHLCLSLKGPTRGVILVSAVDALNGKTRCWGGLQRRNYQLEINLGSFFLDAPNQHPPKSYCKEYSERHTRRAVDQSPTACLGRVFADCMRNRSVFAGLCICRSVLRHALKYSWV
jgi:hypothetical protein